jgi:hypothetical protein
MDDGSIAALAIVCIFGFPIAGWIIIRIMQHNERMEMIKRGMIPPHGQTAWAPPPSAPPGMQPAMVPNYEAQLQLRKGIRTAFIGLALFIGLSFIGFNGNDFRPGPWLLGGLIPLFVGIAQIITAMLGGADFPRARMHVPPGNPYAQSPPPPPPPPSGPYAYRPPGNQEELPRTKPPDKV